MSTDHRSFGFFFVWFQAQKYLSIDGDITYRIYLGVHFSTTGLKSVC